MRTYVRAACLALTITVLAASGAVAKGAPRLGYINSQLVLQQAPGRTALEAQLKTQMAPFEKRMSVMQDSTRSMTRVTCGITRARSIPRVSSAVRASACH